MNERRAIKTVEDETGALNSEVFEQAMNFVSMPSFWVPDWDGSGADWIAHTPFAFWLTEALCPSFFVELGTDQGTSYAAICQAVAALELDARCVAIFPKNEETRLRGDEEAQFGNVRACSESRYSGFSEILQYGFEEALLYFEDGTIDLLHLGKCDQDQGVQHVFESWLPKLSRKGVVIIDDSGGRDRESEARRYWSDVKQQWPHFEFFHGRGLGVLGVGEDLPERVRRLFEINGQVAVADAIRAIYTRLGRTHELRCLGKAADAQRKESIAPQAKPDRAPESFSSPRDTWEADELQKRLAAMKKSGSWRLTAPLRRIEHLFSWNAGFVSNLKEEIRILLWRILSRFEITRKGKMLADQVALITKSGLLHSYWYKDQYEERPAVSGHPALHYLLSGARGGCNPNPLFNTRWYLATYPEVAATGINPLLHYIQFGASMGFNPGPDFDTSSYAARNPAWASTSLTPLSYFFKRGKSQADIASRVSDDATARITAATGEDDSALASMGYQRLGPVAATEANRILVIGDGPPPVFPKKSVEGGGLRTWGLARSLREALPDAEVTLAYREVYRNVSEDGMHDGVMVATWTLDQLPRMIASASVVVVTYSMADVSVLVAGSVHSDQLLVIDCYSPAYIEVSARGAENIEGELNSFLEEIKRWNHVLSRGDIFLCANEPQRKFYTGILSALGLVNPENYSRDPILIVPFGISEEEPAPRERPCSALIKNPGAWKVMWFGGIYPWFDLRGLMDAIELVNEKRPCELLIVGASNPFVQHPDFEKRFRDAVAHASQPQLADIVHFQEWIPFEERADWYCDSDLVVLINEIGVENEYAWRTRLVDYAWGGMLVVSNGGDPLSEILFKHDAAVKLTSTDRHPMAEQLLRILGDRERAESVKANLRALRKEFYWSKVIAPLATQVKKHWKRMGAWESRPERERGGRAISASPGH